jgi:D-sedoheptulose 7-phosphate isomerase
MPNEIKQYALSEYTSEIEAYIQELRFLLGKVDVESVKKIKNALQKCWQNKKTVYLIGNGGSEANATHLANDLIYGLGKNTTKNGIKAISLSTNISVTSAISNDEGYEHIYEKQLKTLAEPGDLLLVFSGSGNSKNIITCLKTAKKMGIQTAGFLGFDGGKAKELLDYCVYTKTFNMQASEDLQIVLGHAIARDLASVTKDLNS